MKVKVPLRDRACFYLKIPGVSQAGNGGTQQAFVPRIIPATHTGKERRTKKKKTLEIARKIKTHRASNRANVTDQPKRVDDTISHSSSIPVTF